MRGPTILARTLTTSGAPERDGRRWQYHSRSNHHAKVASWTVALDLLEASALLRAQVAAGQLVLGLNHAVTVVGTHHRKRLDLVIARRAGITDATRASFVELASTYALPLADEERDALAELPILHQGPVGALLVAITTKACMTAHIKSLRRLFDELDSTHLCVHGASTVSVSPSSISRMTGAPSRWSGSHPRRCPVTISTMRT